MESEKSKDAESLTLRVHPTDEEMVLIRRAIRRRLNDVAGATAAAQESKEWVYRGCSKARVDSNTTVELYCYGGAWRLVAYREPNPGPMVTLDWSWKGGKAVDLRVVQGGGTGKWLVGVHYALTLFPHLLGTLHQEASRAHTTMLELISQGAPRPTNQPEKETNE